MLGSLRFRLTLVFGALTLVVAAVLAWRLGDMLRDEALRGRAQALTAVATGAALMFSEGLHERLREVTLLAQGKPESAGGLNLARWQQEVQMLQASRPHYTWIGVADVAGAVRVATGNLLLGADVSASPWFRGAQQGPYLGDLHPALLLESRLPQAAEGGPRQPLQFLDLAAPLADDEGQIAGVLAVHIDRRWMAEVISLVRQAELREAGARVFVLDRDGKVIHRGADLGPDARLDEPLAAANSASAQLLRWADGARYLTVAAAVPARTPLTDLGWTVVVRQPEAQALAAVAGAQRAVWRVGALAALLTMGVTWLLAAHFSRPLQDIADAARRIETGELATELPVSRRSSELATLSQALASMVRRLVEREQALVQAKDELEQRVAERTAELAGANAKLDRLAHEDALTALPNRRAADALLESRFAQHQRSRRPLAVLLADIDHFKRVNDSFGHPAGDEVLRVVARRLASALRASDVVARFGGEEFVVVLPDTDGEGLAAVGEKLRLAVAAAPVPPAGQVSISLGATVLLAGDSLAQMLHRADQALYAAKAGGRNRLVHNLG